LSKAGSRTDRILNQGVRLFTFAVVLFVVMPAVIIVISAFNDQSFLAFPPKKISMRWFAAAFTSDDFRNGFINSLWVMVWSSTLAVIVGTAFSIASQRMNFVGKAVFESAILSPLIVPHFTIGLGVLMLFVQTNYAQSFVPVVACHVILVLPFVIRSVYISLHNLDVRLELAAASLGATPRKILVTITLPLLLPGIVGGWLFSAVLSFNEFTGTVFVVSRTTQTLPVTMYNYVREHTDPTVAAISTLYILTTMVLIVSAFLALAPRGLAIPNKQR
jgi:putative spermidine/putrescine transport system permease protein